MGPEIWLLFFNLKLFKIMKRYVLLAAIVLTSSMCFAQSASVFRSEVTGKLLDTVTNTAVKFQKSVIGGPKSATAVQVTITKISGTVAGVVRLYGSLDGINFARVAVADSLIATNVATQAKIFNLDKNLYQSLRVGYTGAGTMSATLKAVSVSAPLR